MYPSLIFIAYALTFHNKEKIRMKKMKSASWRWLFTFSLSLSFACETSFLFLSWWKVQWCLMKEIIHNWHHLQCHWLQMNKSCLLFPLLLLLCFFSSSLWTQSNTHINAPPPPPHLHLSVLRLPLLPALNHSVTFNLNGIHLPVDSSAQVLFLFSPSTITSMKHWLSKLASVDSTKQTSFLSPCTCQL